MNSPRALWKSLRWAVAGAGIVLAPALSFGQGAEPPAADPASTPPGAEAGVGGLLVTPTRLVFEGRRRNAEITVVNRGTAETTFRVGFVQMTMDGRGRVAEVAELPAGQGPADPMVRFSPRQFTLPPQTTQTVRLQVRRPAGLATGEYRSHLTVRIVPPAEPEPGLGETTSGPGSRGFQVRLVPVYGVSVPVIVRHGEVAATVRLGEPEVVPAAEEGERALRLQIHREGDRSVYGDLRVVHFAPGGRQAEVGILKGVAVYTPLADRLVAIPLRPASGWPLQGGELRVEYVDAEGSGATLARASFSLP